VSCTSTGVAVCGGETSVTGLKRCHNAVLCSFWLPANWKPSTVTTMPPRMPSIQ
jgi:hypothetical protein